MRILRLIIVTMITFAIFGCCAPVKNMVLVNGGTYKSDYKEKDKPEPVEVEIKDFYIGKYEVTQAQWKEVMGKNPSGFNGDSLPVEKIRWYDAVIFCNKLSEMEDLDKCYIINEVATDSSNFKEDFQVKYTVTCNWNADGYRLPTEAEWEYASRGGRRSRGYKYSGSNDIDEVGWYIRNSGDKILTEFYQANMYDRDSLKMNNNSIKAVGRKKPNELGIYDMTGNVYEYCWDFKDYTYINYQVELGDPEFGREILVHQRIAIGGSWMDDLRESTIYDRMLIAPYASLNSNGLRVARNRKCFFR